MKEPGDSRAEGLSVVAIFLIVVMGTALSVLAWQYLRERRGRQLDNLTRINLSALVEVVDSELGELYQGVHRHARVWARPEFDERSGAWQQSADLFLSDHPSVLAILRADPSWQVAGSPEGRQSLREVLNEMDRRKADEDGDVVAGPFEVMGGKRVVGIQVTVARNPTDECVIVAVLDPQVALQRILDQRALNHALVVSANGEEIYRRGPQVGETLALFQLTQPLPMRTASKWTVTARPTSDALGPFDASPGLALADGLLASLLVAAVAHFGSLAWRRQSALRRANSVLAQQIDDNRRGEFERKELDAQIEARIATRTAGLDETILELETFNYSISHDLRGPLGAVINFAAILGEDYREQLNATGKEHLQRIVSSATAAVSMMDALLTFSQSGKTELRKTHLDVRKLVQEVVAEITSRTTPARGSVDIGELPDAYADEAMMRLIFSNLISNAYKFARKDVAPEIGIGGSLTANEVTYFVRDAGIGFDMRFVDKLFKVFERLHTTDRFEGHGVGLAIAARMVRRHGGRVWAKGALEKGATFYFSVPTRDMGNNERSTI